MIIDIAYDKEADLVKIQAEHKSYMLVVKYRNLLNNRQIGHYIYDLLHDDVFNNQEDQ